MATLLTAFEPFGGNASNISLDVLNYIDSPSVMKGVLPVSFNLAPIILREYIDDCKPDIVIMLGQCGDSGNVRLERFAHNLMDSQKADNDGYIPNEEGIYGEAPLAYKTSLPIKDISNECQEQGLPVVLSNTTGLYVCNRVYFEALHEGQKALFIHIPKNFDINKATHIIEYIIGQL